MSDATPSPWVFSFENIDPEWSVVTTAGGAVQALSVAHLWDMPNIVRDYLTALAESIRVADAAAWDAARDEFDRRVYEAFQTEAAK